MKSVRNFALVVAGIIIPMIIISGIVSASPLAQDITVPFGSRGDINLLYRSFDGGSYQAQTVSLAPFDEDTGAAVMIETVHHEVHEGEMWHAEYSNASVSNGSDVDILMTVGASVDAHTVFEIFAGGQVTVTLFESPTVAANGTAVAAYNMNRTITETAASAIYHTPTITSTGSTRLVNGRVLPGGTSPQTRVGGGVRQNVEWILAPSKTYLLRIKNTSGSSIAINTVLEWYEED